MVEFFYITNHFQKRFLRQVLRKQRVARGFQKEAGNIVVIQPDECIERLPVAALALFHQGFFIHHVLLLHFSLDYTPDSGAGWLFYQHQQRAADDQDEAEGRFFRQALVEHQRREADGHQNAQLIDGDDDAGEAVL